MIRRLVVTALLAAAPLTAVPQAARAQSGAASQPYAQTISINPLGLPFGIFSAEYERVVSGGLTVGVGGTYASGFYEDDDEEDARDAWVEGKLLYYPNETPLRGFSVGLTLGYHNARNDGSSLFGPGGTVRSEGAPTVGVLLDYNWLIGPRKRFLIGTGIGARRVLKNVDSNSPLSQVYPDGRLQIGIAY
jgi:hypothetical protein